VPLVSALALLLIAHGLVHFSLNTVPYGPATPYWPSWWRPEPARSWLLQTIVGDDATRVIGGSLLLVSTAGFILAGLALAGWGLPQTWWPSLTLVSGVASVVLFALFPLPWLVVGMALTAASLWAAWVRWPA
jgi:hypothetical protein